MGKYKFITPFFKILKSNVSNIFKTFTENDIEDFYLNIVEKNLEELPFPDEIDFWDEKLHNL